MLQKALQSGSRWAFQLEIPWAQKTVESLELSFYRQCLIIMMVRKWDAAKADQWGQNCHGSHQQHESFRGDTTIKSVP